MSGRSWTVSLAGVLGVVLNVVLGLAVPGRATADAGALFGESARAVSLADAVVARPGDTSAIFFNPAGVADIDRPTLVLYGNLGNARMRFARTDELGSTTDHFEGGYGASIVSPLPGPPWLRRVRIGGSVYLPGETIIRVRAPVRSDTPLVPYYGDRLDRTAATVAIAVDLPWTIRLGGAVTVTPNLYAPTVVGFDAGRGETVDEGVFVTQDRELTLGASFLLGARVAPIEELAFGLVWRQGGATRASGSFDIGAGSIRVIDDYRFYDLIAPEEVALGVAVFPMHELSLSLDATWGRWSQYRTIHDEAPEPGFSDVIDLRVGAEWTAHRALRVRAGYAFLPSPVPEQTGRHNFLDAHRHEIGLGLGLDLESLTGFPLRVDVALRFHVLHTQSAQKDATTIPDASPDSPGHTISNFGYPGFTARGSYSQVALSLTFPLGPPVRTDAEDDAEGDAEDDDEAEPEP